MKKTSPKEPSTPAPLEPRMPCVGRGRGTIVMGRVVAPFFVGVRGAEQGRRAWSIEKP